MPTCVVCYRRRANMFSRDDRVYCSGCLLKALVAEGLIQRLES